MKKKTFFKIEASASGLAVSGNATDVTIGTLAMQMRSVQAGECDKVIKTDKDIAKRKSLKDSIKFF